MLDQFSLGLVALLGAIVLFLLWRDRSRGQKQRLHELEIIDLRRTLAATTAAQQMVEQRLSAFASVTLDGLLMVDREHQVLFTNPMARQIFDLTGMPLTRTLMSFSRNHELDDMVDAVLRANEPFESQIAINERSFRVRAIVATVQEQPCVALALQDVTELLRVTRARRDMVTNIAHDLGTPISTIKLVLETIQIGAESLPDKVRKNLGRIVGQIDSLDHMRNEVMYLATIESGKAIIKLVDINLATVIQGALETMTAQAEDRGLQIKQALPSELMVLADPEQVRRVLNNLLHNAIKFTPKQGTIIVSATTQAGDEGDVAKVSVIDTGRGIAPQDRSRIFERFYQVEGSRSGSKAQTGAGLGLSIAKHIITAHGGTIWAEPNLPTGTNISFTLPIPTAAMPIAPIAPIASPSQPRD